jgi:hypothetical protein
VLIYTLASLFASEKYQMLFAAHLRSSSAD